MKEDSTKDDVDMKPAAGKKSPLELAPAVEPSEDRKSTPATAKDRKEARKMRRKKRQTTVGANEDIAPLPSAAALAAATNQASASR